MVHPDLFAGSGRWLRGDGEEVRSVGSKSARLRCVGVGRSVDTARLGACATLRRDGRQWDHAGLCEYSLFT
jgi:hypothetical protein